MLSCDRLIELNHTPEFVEKFETLIARYKPVVGVSEELFKLVKLSEEQQSHVREEHDEEN